MRRWFGYAVMGAMVLGIVAGLALNAWLTPAGAKEASGDLSIITGLFLSLIKMLIAPLVFSTLVVGVAHMEDTAAIGRVGIKKYSNERGIPLRLRFIFIPNTGRSIMVASFSITIKFP